MNEFKHSPISFPAMKEEKEERISICDALVLTSVVLGFSKQQEIVLQDPYLFRYHFLKGNSEAGKKVFLRLLAGNLGMHEPRLKWWGCLGGDCGSPSSVK